METNTFNVRISKPVFFKVIVFLSKSGPDPPFSSAVAALSSVELIVGHFTADQEPGG